MNEFVKIFWYNQWCYTPYYGVKAKHSEEWYEDAVEQRKLDEINNNDIVEVKTKAAYIIKGKIKTHTEISGLPGHESSYTACVVIFEENGCMQQIDLNQPDILIRKVGNEKNV